MRVVAVALGSNLGAREAHLGYAVQRLTELVQELRVSAIHETEPEGPLDQPRYLNAVAVGTTTLDPASLLRSLLEIERERGRRRPAVSVPRTLDLDLILAGDAVIESATLTLPHPRFRRRRFVLEPLVEVAPDLVDPVTGCTVRELLQRL